VIEADENFYGSLDTIMRAIQTGRYPSPPARDLYLVSKGKPTDPVIIAFLDWILTDGQQFVHEGGYVELSEDKVINEKSKLK
jgi:phosphate transport system substrate-binding protein